MKPHSNQAQRKWEIVETFCFSYICQPPQEYWEDDEFMAEREFLLKAIGNNVHVTNWKQIFKEYSEMRPVTLSIKHAKEFYEAEVQNRKTDAYKAIEGYFSKVDNQREIIRNTPDCDIAIVTTYMKEGDSYFSCKGADVSHLKKNKKK